MKCSSVGLDLCGSTCDKTDLSNKHPQFIIGLSLVKSGISEPSYNPTGFVFTMNSVVKSSFALVNV